MTYKCYKHRINSLGWHDRIHTIQRGVGQVHIIVERTFLLLKSYYLEVVYPNRDAHHHWLKDKLIQEAFDVVRVKTTSDTSLTYKELFHIWKRDYLPNVANNGHIGPKLSLSHILAYVKTQIRTAYANNIRQRFPQYVERCVRVCLVNIISERIQCDFYRLPGRDRKEWYKEITKVYNALMNRRVFVSPHAFINEWIHDNRDILIPSTITNVWGALKSKSPAVCFKLFRHMVTMNRMLDDAQVHSQRFRRLPSPFPLRRSCIPAHIIIDHSGMLHLLATLEDINAFKLIFEREYHVSLVNLRAKRDICASYSKLTGLSDVTAEDEERYRDAWWKYFFPRFAGRHLKKLMIPSTTRLQGSFGFSHMITTDGYSASLLVTDDRVRGCKEWCHDELVDVEAVDIPFLSAETYTVVRQELACLDGVVEIGADPGKRNVLTMVNEQGHTLVYSSAQRRHEMGMSKKQRQRTQNALKATIPSLRMGGMDWNARKVEKVYLRGVSSRSCYMPTYTQYVERKLRVESAMFEVYSKPIFRANRFLAWTKQGVSELRLLKNIKEKFASDETPVVMYVGAWGSQPNLRHQVPSPGIGLLRRLSSCSLPSGQSRWRLHIYRVSERFSSSVCPRLHNGVHCDHDVRKHHAHHTLRCVHCRTLWQRDKLGATNILRNAQHLIRNGSQLPIFA